MTERVFQRGNVVKRTDSDYQAENYLNAGYTEVTEGEKVETVSYAKMKIEELKALLVERGIEFDAKATKDELVALAKK